MQICRASVRIFGELDYMSVPPNVVYHRWNEPCMIYLTTFSLINDKHNYKIMAFAGV